MMFNKKLFSVLISVYKNDHPSHLNIALRSIYHQQTLKPSEIVIVADGPLKEQQLKIINSFINDVPEGVIKFIRLDKNIGLAAALNEGIAVCNYDIIARMDADDISLPTRFELQYEFMQTHPDVDVCGTLIDEIDTETETYISTRKVPLTHESILTFAKRQSAVNHPSVMYKRDKIINVGGYPLFRKSQDFALWSLLLVNNARFANLNQVLLKMRTGKDFLHRRGISHLKYEYQVLLFQKKIGFINRLEFYKFITLRTIFRILPVHTKRMLYSLVRKMQS